MSRRLAIENEEVDENDVNNENINMTNLPSLAKIAGKHAKAIRKTAKIQKIVDTLHERLCWDMRVVVSSYLTVFEILTKLQTLSKKWRQFCLDSRLWNLV